MSSLGERFRRFLFEKRPGMERNIKHSQIKDRAEYFLKKTRNPYVSESDIPGGEQFSALINDIRANEFFKLLPDSIHQFTYKGQVYHRLSQDNQGEIALPWSEEDLIAHLKFLFGDDWTPPGRRD